MTRIRSCIHNLSPFALARDALEAWPWSTTGSPSRTISSRRSSALTGGERNAQWWTGPAGEGETRLTDDAVDWIETVANDEADPIL